jgi:hypothetical protein
LFERAQRLALGYPTNEMSPWNEGEAEWVVEEKETGERQSFLPHGNAMGERASRVTMGSYSEFGGKGAD